VALARIAIVGTGAIARSHMIALRGLQDQAEVVAGADTDATRLSAFCAEYGVPGRHANLDEMLQAVQPDLVHLCTPPGLHSQQAEQCLRRGVSVLAEKPPVVSLRELDHLATVQGTGKAIGSGTTGGGTSRSTGDAGGSDRATGPWFATVFQHRFGTGIRRVQGLASAGWLGRPLLAVCHTTWFRDQSYFDVEWRGRWDTEGGGPTMGQGIHQFDMLLAVLGDWTEVSAVVRRQARRTQTEDLSLAHVTFANGAVASVVNSVLSPREESYLRFDFERATVEVTHLYGYRDEDWRITAAPEYELDMHAAWQQAGEASVPSGHRAQFTEVLRCLREGQPLPVTLAESRRTMSLAAGIYAAAFGGHAVRPEDLGPSSPFYTRMDGGASW
jgi:predicted dehydrogenase